MFQYLGTVDIDGFDGDVPVTSVFLSGWLAFNDGTWAARINETLTINVCVEYSNQGLLEAFNAPGLMVWGTGVLFASSRAANLLILGKFDVYRLPDAPVSSRAADLLRANDERRAIDRIVSPSRAPGRGSLHPVAHSALTDLPCPDEYDPSILVHLVQAEAMYRSANNIISYDTLYRMGTLTYDPSGREVSARAPASSFVDGVVAGVLASSNDHLKLVQTVIYYAKRIEDYTRAGRCVFVVPKHALPVLHARASHAMNVHLVLTQADLSRVEEFDVVITTLEFYERHPFPHVRFDRCVVLDWPLVFAHLKGNLPNSSFNVLISRNDDLGPLDGQTLVTAFKLPGQFLHNPGNLLLHLASRALVQADEGQLRRVVRYTETASLPDESERRSLLYLTGSKYLKNLLFTNLKSGFCPAVRDGSAALEHFRSRDLEVSAYAMANLKGNADGQECEICYEREVNCFFRCGHRFCGECTFVCINSTSKCPVCKTRLDRSRDVVILNASRQSGSFMDTVVLDYVLSIRDKKVAVLSDFGSEHEKSASSWRAKGVRCTVFRGSSVQIQKNSKAFESWNSGVLFVDPSTVSLSWHDFQLDHVVVILPVRTADMPICCRLKPLFTRGRAIELKVFNRANQSLPETPDCGKNCHYFVRS